MDLKQWPVREDVYGPLVFPGQNQFQANNRNNILLILTKTRWRTLWQAQALETGLVPAPTFLFFAKSLDSIPNGRPQIQGLRI